MQEIPADGFSNTFLGTEAGESNAHDFAPLSE
jgi:hypothetical protein